MTFPRYWVMDQDQMRFRALGVYNTKKEAKRLVRDLTRSDRADPKSRYGVWKFIGPGPGVGEKGRSNR
jgi:hypothetical protein